MHNSVYIVDITLGKTEGKLVNLKRITRGFLKNVKSYSQSPLVIHTFDRIQIPNTPIF